MTNALLHTRYFEDVTQGQPLPSFQVAVTLQQLVRYAEASRDYARIHYEEEQGRKSPWGTVILHGMLKSGFLARLAGDFAAGSGIVHRISFNYRKPDFPGESLTVSGAVARTW